jgi:hypothetical protein
MTAADIFLAVFIGICIAMLGLHGLGALFF